MSKDATVQLLGRTAAVEFTLGAIIKSLPPESRDGVQQALTLFLERSDLSQESGRAVAEAARSILKEAGDQTA